MRVFCICLGPGVTRTILLRILFLSILVVLNRHPIDTQWTYGEWRKESALLTKTIPKVNTHNSLTGYKNTFYKKIVTIGYPKTDLVVDGR